MITTEQMKAWLEKLVYETASLGKLCLSGSSHAHQAADTVEVSRYGQNIPTLICAACLAELVNEGADDGMVTVRRDDLAFVVAALRGEHWDLHSTDDYHRWEQESVTVEKRLGDALGERP